MSNFCISARGQKAMIWWAFVTMLIYGFSMYFGLHMMPPPPVSLTPAEVAAFYQEHGQAMRIGAMIMSWSSAFMLPFSVVIAVQMMRLEKGIPFWSILQIAGGIMMSIFLVLPPIFWGVAAFNPSRPAEVTALMHELACLTMTTTDQYYIFQMVALTCLSLSHKHDANSAFPRWVGFLTLWAALAFEVGAFAFVAKSGPLAWNGALVFWMPLVVFGSWITTVCVVMLRAITRQQASDTVHIRSGGQHDTPANPPVRAIPA